MKTMYFDDSSKKGESTNARTNKEKLIKSLYKWMSTQQLWKNQGISKLFALFNFSNASNDFHK